MKDLNLNLITIIIIFIVIIITIFKWKLSVFNKKKRNFNLKFLNKIPILNPDYNTFYIPKRDWSERQIDAPNTQLKNIQKNILRELNKTYLFPSFVSWFKKNASIKNNASKHTNKKIIINIDIEDFFHSITENKIRKTLRAYKELQNEEIEKLINLVTYRWRLAQWAPTSPFIANLVFLWIDNIIIKLLKKYDKKVSYTRYADDITFSSNNTKIKNAIRIIVDSILPKYGYVAKKKKTTIYRAHTKQIVTGLVVNKRVSYPRNKYMKLRAMVFNFLSKWDWNINIIKWHLSFLKSVDRKKYLKLKFYYRRNFKENNNYKVLFNKQKKKHKKASFTNPHTWKREVKFDYSGKKIEKNDYKYESAFENIKKSKKNNDDDKNDLII